MVDVGGGIGVTISPLAERYPDLNIVIQDLPIVVGEGQKARQTTLFSDYSV